MFIHVSSLLKPKALYFAAQAVSICVAPDKDQSYDVVGSQSGHFI